MNFKYNFFLNCKYKTRAYIRHYNCTKEIFIIFCIRMCINITYIDIHITCIIYKDDGS